MTPSVERRELLVRVKKEKMPRVWKDGGKKRKFTKRRKFVARSRNQVANKTGAQNNPFVGFVRPLSGGSPFPVSTHRSHTYCQLFTMTTGTGLLGTQQAIRLNSLYDPDYTGAGHQPGGFDQMIVLYDRYRVDRVKFQLLFTTPGAANDILCVACVNPNLSQGLTGANMQFPIETQSCLHGPLSSNGERRCVLQANLDMHKLLGVTRAAYVAEEDYSAPTSTNPVQEMSLTIATGCYDGTGGVACQLQVIITYETFWYGRRNPGAS